MNSTSNRKLGARQYILSKRELYPDLSVAASTNELIDLKIYKKNQHKTAHKWVLNVIKRGTVEDKKRKRHKPTNTTTVKRIEKIYKETKGTTAGSVRRIKDRYESDYKQSISHGSTHTILFLILLKRRRSIRRIQ